jgi:hypothetical protein
MSHDLVLPFRVLLTKVCPIRAATTEKKNSLYKIHLCTASLHSSDTLL